MEVRALYHP